MDAGVLDCVLELMCEDFKHFEEHAADRSDREAADGRVSFYEWKTDGWLHRCGSLCPPLDPSTGNKKSDTYSKCLHIFQVDCDQKRGCVSNEVILTLLLPETKILYYLSSSAPDGAVGEYRPS